MCGAHIPNSVDKAYIDIASFDFMVEKAFNISEIAMIANAELRLRKYIESKWDIRKAEATIAAARLATKMKPHKQISSSIKSIMAKWQKDVMPIYNTEMRRVYRLARIGGYKKATGQSKASLQFNIPKTNYELITKAKTKPTVLPKFDLVDEAAMDALEEKNTFWVGNHYDANISDAIQETAKTTMIEAGESTTIAGSLMKDRIASLLGRFTTPYGYTGTQEQYFEGLVSNAMTVGRVYGQLRSFSQIGITKYTIVNPGGSRICEVCAALQGTTFTTSQGLKQIKKEYAATSPKDIKKIHPWPRLASIEGKSANALSRMGLSLPPYHFRCRCTVDVSGEIESYVELVPITFPIPPSKAA